MIKSSDLAREAGSGRRAGRRALLLARWAEAEAEEVGRRGEQRSWKKGRGDEGGGWGASEVDGVT